MIFLCEWSIVIQNDLRGFHIFSVFLISFNGDLLTVKHSDKERLQKGYMTDPNSFDGPFSNSFVACVNGACLRNAGE